MKRGEKHVGRKQARIDRIFGPGRLDNIPNTDIAYHDIN